MSSPESSTPSPAESSTPSPAGSPTPSPAESSPLSREPYGGRPYLPTNPAERKGLPICTGVLDYFPLALLEVARVSRMGNDQHNPGQPLHHARGKSMDQADTAVRHIMERGGKDVDGCYHLAKAAWRILADLQLDLEHERGLPIARGATAE